jgi:hypothetical protein
MILAESPRRGDEKRAGTRPRKYVIRRMRFHHGPMRPRALSPRFVLLGALLPLVSGGCDSCHGNKPYTPYTLSDGPSAAPVASSVAAAPSGDAALSDAGSSVDAAAPPSFAVLQGTTPPGDGKSWPLDGDIVATAPIGRTFAAGLVLDMDGDGKRDLLAWSRAPDGLRGELWFAPGSNVASARTLAAMPEGLASPGCSVTTQLSQIGPRTLVLDVAPRCGGAHDKAIRWIAVLRLADAAAPELGLELRLGAPLDGEALQVAVDARDRDGDGRADVLATITLTGAPRPLASVGAQASASLAFFDRPTGLSRDPSEPEASFKATAASLIADGRRKTTAPRIPGAALALRRLHALLCEEGGKAVITTSAGPVRCGDARVLEDAGMAEVEAALNLGEPLAALAARARLEAMGVHRKDVDALVAKSIPTVTAKALHKTAAAPAIEPSPAFAPLAWDNTGDLLVHTVDKVIRIDHSAFAEAPIDAALAWPTRLVFPAGAGADAPSWKIIAVERRCDEPTLTARLASGEVALPIAVPARCTPSSRVTAELLGASDQGALLAVGADVVALPLAAPLKPALLESLAPAAGAAVELGAARSPNGATIAVPTDRGVFVAAVKSGSRAAKGKLWTGADLDGAYQCVPSNGGERLACVTGSAATIFEAK